MMVLFIPFIQNIIRYCCITERDVSVSLYIRQRKIYLAGNLKTISNVIKHKRYIRFPNHEGSSRAKEIQNRPQFIAPMILNPYQSICHELDYHTAFCCEEIRVPLTEQARIAVFISKL